MTRRRELEQHRNSLGEIREIMNSMKTLAYMETRKLSRFLDAQQAVVANIGAAAADLLSFYPDLLPTVHEPSAVYLLIGTERGFCGEFNHALLHELDAITAADSAGTPILVAVGHKLHTLLENDARAVSLIDGASVVEEVHTLLNQLVDELTALQQQHGILTVYCLHHGRDGSVLTQQVLPPFEAVPRTPPRFADAPDLHRAPHELLAELAEHQLFALLHEMLYTSLMAENYARVKHLEGAVQHLDDKEAELARQCNALRQEEIIEEIEVLLLSSSTLQEGWRK